MSKEMKSELMDNLSVSEVAILESFLTLNDSFRSMANTVIAGAKVVEALIERVEKLEELALLKSKRIEKLETKINQ